jgi:hypothetical protein
MSLQSVPLLSFDFLPSRPVEIEVSPVRLVLKMQRDSFIAPLTGRASADKTIGLAKA